MTTTAVRPLPEQTATAPAGWQHTSHRYGEQAQAEASWLAALDVGEPRDPAVSADLVAMLAEHGLRRLPEHAELSKAMGRARRREARYLSAGRFARAWLRAGDRHFLRRHALRHLGDVAAAVQAGCHDPHEVRLVGLLTEVLTTR
jgi:hypothetical protein